jgi:hypothetical protein
MKSLRFSCNIPPGLRLSDRNLTMAGGLLPHPAETPRRFIEWGERKLHVALLEQAVLDVVKHLDGRTARRKERGKLPGTLRDQALSWLLDETEDVPDRVTSTRCLHAIGIEPNWFREQLVGFLQREGTVLIKGLQRQVRTMNSVNVHRASAGGTRNGASSARSSSGRG